MPQALRAAGHGALLPEPYPVRERALASLGDQKWPDALEELRRYLWQSTVTADWAGELDAHERLGDLFALTRRPMQAVEHYIWAGERDKLEKLAHGLPDELIAPSHLAEHPETVNALLRTRSPAPPRTLLRDEDAVAWCPVAPARDR